MGGDNFVGLRHVLWKMNIPEIVVDLYFDHVRGFPTWRQAFPRYVHPAVRDAVKLAYNKTRMVTQKGEYVFHFEERSTFITEAAEFVKTGVLDVYYNRELVLRLGVSPPDSELAHKKWTPRYVEEFKEGEWVNELRQLAPEFANYERQQRMQDQALREDTLKGMDELKAKLSKPPPRAEKSSFFRWPRRRSGG
jgi:hypothetical protein